MGQLDVESKAGGGLLGSNMGMSNSRITGSNLNLLKQELEGQAPLEGARAYTHLECTYLLSVV